MQHHQQYLSSNDKTMEQLEAELKEFFTTNAQGRSESWARNVIRSFAWKEQSNDIAQSAEADRTAYKIQLPKELSYLSDRVIDIITRWPARFNSNHEALSVLEEEVKELRDEVYQKEDNVSRSKIYEEAADIASVAIRIMIEARSERFLNR